MADLEFSVARRDDYKHLAKWLWQVSQTPQQHCLHTWSGQMVSELQQQLLSYWSESELCYVVVRRDGHLIGAMGSEYDEHLERAWLHGPHVTAKDWELIASQLFDRLGVELPACIRQFDAFLNVENFRGRRFYTQQKFKERKQLNYEFWLTPGQQVIPRESNCIFLSEFHESSFKQLFNELFPSAYYSPERIIHMIGQSHTVFILAEEEAVLGFVVLSVEPGQSVGEIQFFGVREDYRRRGIGKRLLLSAIDWLVNTRRVSRVSLNVGEEKVHAKDLYEQVGFRLRFTGIGLRKSYGD